MCKATGLWKGTVVMARNIRRHHIPTQKVRLLWLHLLEDKPISDICEAEGINPTLFCQ
jgi:hypothetical protein